MVRLSGRRMVCVGVACLTMSPAGVAGASAGTATTVRISVGPDGAQGDGHSLLPMPSARVLSQTGRYVLFESRASNLVPGDSNRANDTFVRDQLMSTTQRVSVSSDGAQQNRGSDPQHAAISADGRFVVFGSFASNLVRGDDNNAEDAFIRDRVAGTTVRVSIRPSGGAFVRGSRPLDVSADGRYVTFQAQNRGYYERLFLRDRLLHTTTLLANLRSGYLGSYRDGGYLAAGPVVVFTYRRWLGGQSSSPSAFVRVVDRTGRPVSTLARVLSRRCRVLQIGAITESGRSIAFDCWPARYANDGVGDVFVWDRAGDTVTRLTQGYAPRFQQLYAATLSLSDDGRYAAFSSFVLQLPGQPERFEPDIFVRDLATSTVTRVDLTPDGQLIPNGAAAGGGLSGDGSTVAFGSPYDDVVPGDTNGRRDVFVRGPLLP